MKFSEILTAEDIRGIKSKALYWDEVKERDDKRSVDEILYGETWQECGRLGAKILWVLKEAARLASEEATPGAKMSENASEKDKNGSTAPCSPQAPTASPITSNKDHPRFASTDMRIDSALSRIQMLEKEVFASKHLCIHRVIEAAELAENYAARDNLTIQEAFEIFFNKLKEHEVK